MQQAVFRLNQPQEAEQQQYAAGAFFAEAHGAALAGALTGT